ncbi:hypothetical protein CDAR_608551 [Caerostris darwini]|uniref:Uncharacterized protein n=1 Tax=Caerostris darwini TaxID=1538125 RepID=A0AAV4WLE2_9ARAC|nr:hypothetical protein CDAR_608551 [Caerostris darwini]
MEVNDYSIPPPLPFNPPPPILYAYPTSLRSKEQNKAEKIHRQFHSAIGTSPQYTDPFHPHPPGPPPIHTHTSPDRPPSPEAG